jgi:hypothetical protein
VVSVNGRMIRSTGYATKAEVENFAVTVMGWTVIEVIGEEE